MPITSLSPSGSPQTATRAALVRLVIFERAVLFCPAQPADERSLPPAESSAEAIEVARQLAHGGYHLAIASQHPGVARGVLEMTSVNAQNRRLLRQLDEAGARIEAIAICPHGPDAGCACRLPEPGMLSELIGRFGAAAEATAIIATTREAAEAGAASGCRTLWVGGAVGTGPGDATGGAMGGESGSGAGIEAVASLADAAAKLLDAAETSAQPPAEPPTAPTGAGGAGGAAANAGAAAPDRPAR